MAVLVYAQLRRAERGEVKVPEVAFVELLGTGALGALHPGVELGQVGGKTNSQMPNAVNRPAVFTGDAHTHDRCRSSVERSGFHGAAVPASELLERSEILLSQSIFRGLPESFLKGLLCVIETI